jgi:hypothetical protein
MTRMVSGRNRAHLRVRALAGSIFVILCHFPALGITLEDVKLDPKVLAVVISSRDPGPFKKHLEKQR